MILPSRPESLEQLHKALDRFWTALATARGEVAASDLRSGLATAVGEVAANIIRYAKADSFVFRLSLRGEDEVEARFDDGGVPYEGVADGQFDPETLAEGGMGLALARRALHAFDYERLADGNNRWTLVLRLPGPA